MRMTKATFLKVSVPILIVICAYFARGFIRSYIVPGYAHLFYMPSIAQDFKRDFSTADKELAEFGFIAKDSSSAQNGCSTDPFYSHLSETVTCEKSYDSNTIPVTNAFLKSWESESPHLEKTLLSKGWYIDRDTRQPIQNLYGNLSSSALVYTKNHGKIECKLTLGLVAYPYGSTEFSRNKEKTYINERCTRNVKFFGGAEG
jgi:hypothetical protein